ncbi:MAG: glycosyltransferase family 4 protein [Fibrobacterales bacterium]
MKKKLLYAVTIPLTAKAFLKGQLKWFIEKGYDVHLVTSPGEELAEVIEREGCRVTQLSMEREISLKKDVLSFICVLWLLIKDRPSVVNAGTPKASLLFMIASWLLRIPTRVYTLHGLRYQTTTGLKRTILIACEKIASGCATNIMTVSESVKKCYIDDIQVSPNKMVVINKGSCNGFDAEAINVTQLREENRKTLQGQYDLRDKNFVIGFVGRFVKDKGIEELYWAFKELQKKDAQARLLLVGRFEDGDPLSGNLRSEMENDSTVVFTGFVSNVLPFYSIMDLFVLPSFREGLPYTPLEAASCELPVITTRATGAIDSISDGNTGILIDAVDREQLLEALHFCLSNREEIAKYGDAGKAWVKENFQPSKIWNGLLEIYAN